MRLVERFRTALVTGAGSGIGAAVASMLLAQGVRVWGTSRHPAGLPPREGFSPVALELADESSIAAAWRTVEDAAGEIDLLVNNAAGGSVGRFLATPEKAWERQLDILLRGPSRLTRHALPPMIRRDCGAVVNVSSLVVEFPTPFMSAYNAGKAALSAWTESLALELRRTGIQTIDLRLGDFRTNFNQAMARQLSGSGESEDHAVMRRLDELMNRAPRPEQAAKRLHAALVRGERGVVVAGSFFQARLARWFGRLAPPALNRWALRRYYGLR